MLLKDFVQVIESVAPFSLKETYDNSGIQLGSPNQEVTRGLVALDVSPAVVEEAIEKHCDLIVSHHPLIFKEIRSITGASQSEKVIIDCIRQGIAVVSVHTNIDNVFDGVNHRLCSKLGLKNLKILQPVRGILKKLVTFCPADHAGKVREAMFAAGAGHIGDYDCCSFNLEGKGSFRAGEGTNPFAGTIQKLHYEQEERIETIFPVHLEDLLVEAMKGAHPYEEVAYDIYPLDNKYDRAGAGMIGELEEPVAYEDLMGMVKEKLNIPYLRYANGKHHAIQHVAVCGGSGAFLLSAAIKAGAHAFITADIKYHDFIEAKGALLLIDAGHFETEQYTRDLLVDIVTKKMINFALLISETETNPVGYF